MELEVYEREILKNYEYIKKMEEIIPLKKAEIEFKFWNKIKEELEKNLGIKSNNFVENSFEYLTQSHVDILFFKLKNLKSYYGEQVYLGIGRYFNKKGIYFSISDNYLDSKNKKYISFLNTLKNNDNLKEWHSSDRNLYTDFSENIDFGNLFNPECDDFYNLLEEEKFNKIVDTIVELFCKEYKKLNTLKL